MVLSWKLLLLWCFWNYKNWWFFLLKKKEIGDSLILNIKKKLELLIQVINSNNHITLVGYDSIFSSSTTYCVCFGFARTNTKILIFKLLLRFISLCNLVDIWSRFYTTNSNDFQKNWQIWMKSFSSQAKRKWFFHERESYSLL